MLLLKARKASACGGGYREGPPLFIDQTEAPRTAEKKILDTAPSYLILSEGPNPPLAWIGHLV